jgi:tetratricopeptide (TPR) repeat protein
MKNTQQVGRVAIAVLACVLAAQLPAAAWGPHTQTAIVTTAERILSGQNNIPLVNLERDVQAGASLSDEEVQQIVPDAYANLEQTIQSQMYLLQAVHSDRIDPYMAFRLGLLGKLVAQYTAPLADADPTYRNLYYADVDKNISNVPMKASPRRTVDNQIYLATARRQAQARQDLILRDYRQGIGFGGVAKGSLSQEAGRSVDAVADVWYTILSSRSAVGGVSADRLQEYYLRAFDFYLKRKNPQETKRAYDKLTGAGEISPDLRKNIADLYYEAGDFEQAMQEYKTVLAAQPGRKDVVEKVAAYYIRKGDEAAKEQELESAVESYRIAQETDLGNAEAQTKRTQTEASIAQRTASLEKARQAIAQAQQLEQQAGETRARGDFSAAMESLTQALQLYQSVPAEFEAEHLAAQRGSTTVQLTMRELKNQLVQNTDRLSGTAFGVEARRLAAGTATNLHQQAFQDLLQRGYTEEVNKLRQEMNSQLAQQGTR